MYLDSKIDYYLDNKIKNGTIKKNHSKIRKFLNIDKKNFELTEDIIEKLFIIFDKIYFKNLIEDKLYEKHININFGISKKFKNVAGMCKYKNNKVELIFSSYILEKINNDKFKSIEINGIICYDITDVLINLMEHEITHLVLFLYDKYTHDIKSGHNDQFKNLVNNMYGHTKITHDLLSGDVTKYKESKEIASKVLKVGMKIKCKKDNGIVIDIKDQYIMYRVEGKDNKVKGCKFNEYSIIDSKYEKYQKQIDKLRKKIKVGTRIKVLKHKGIVTKIIDNKIYFEEDTTGRQTWWFIDFFELET
jgi:hypothetical protein